MLFIRRWFILTTQFIFLASTVAHGVLSTFRSDGFSANILRDLTNFDVDAVAHSVVTLNDSSVVITGLLRYPPNLITHSSFTDENDVKTLDIVTDIHRFAGMVIRVSTNGTVIWAKRTALCSFETTFTAVYDGSHVYVAGGTDGVPSNDGKIIEGRVLMRYNINGTQESLVVHGEEGERYTSIALSNAEPETLLLVSCAPSDVGIYKNLGDRVPMESGLLVNRVRKSDMGVTKTAIVSDSTSVQGSLLRDNFWDMAVSHDGKSIFISAYRETIRFGVTNFPALFTIGAKTLSMEKTKNMENDLQLDMHIATSSFSEGVYVSYVDRTANKEFLVIRQVTRGLVDMPWGEGLGSTFRYRILLESEFIRETPSIVRDVAVDDDGNVRVLIHSAEVVNATLGRDSPAPSLAVHRQFNNGRPAFVVISPEQAITTIVQAQTEQRWEAFGMMTGEKEHVIIGADRGLVNGGVSKVLLTGVQRHAAPSATPSVSPGTSPIMSPGTSPTAMPSEESAACIGVSTQIGGKRIREIVTDDDRLRLQMHPGRWGKRVGVLCHEWNNGTEDMLCATGDHVIRHWGRLMFMKEFCEIVECEERVEEVMNFKGGCGEEVLAHEALRITMHAGGNDAGMTMKQECEVMGRWWSRWWWWMTSL